MPAVIVSGAGDDGIVLDGDVADEFDCYNPDGAEVRFSDGTRIHFRFGDSDTTEDGAWHATILEQGTAAVGVDRHPVDDPHIRDYTDRVTVIGPIAWVEADDGGRGVRRIATR